MPLLCTQLNNAQPGLTHHFSCSLLTGHWLCDGTLAWVTDDTRRRPHTDWVTKRVSMVFCCIVILHQILLFKSPFVEKCCWKNPCLATLFFVRAMHAQLGAIVGFCTMK